MNGAVVIASGDMAKVLQLVEEALNAVSQAVGDGVVRDGDFARGFGWNDGFGLGIGNQRAQGVAVVSLVGNDALGGDVFEQLRCGGDVVRLAAGEDETQRTASNAKSSPSKLGW
jgi:hypothetical protein